MRLVVAPPNLTDIDSPQAQIDRFVERYGEAHLRLLYHAAFPLSLTPDLIYRLWANIQKDNSGQNTPIPWIAVSDVLCSGFCEKVGYELYELKPDLRRELLRRLSADPRFGEKRLKELAEFMLAYTESFLHSSDPADRNFAQVQRWGALAQLQPNIAARELAQALTHAYQNDADDLNRIAGIAQRLSDALADYPTLLDYARGMARYARGDEAGAVTHFQRLLVDKLTPSVEGILLPLPEELPLDQSNPKKSRSSITSRVWIYRVVLILIVLSVASPLVYEWMQERYRSPLGRKIAGPFRRDRGGNPARGRVAVLEPDLCPRVQPSLTALVPNRDEPVKTSEAHPAFWFYIPYLLTEIPEEFTLEFVLQDEQYNDVYQTAFTLPEATSSVGIISLRLSAQDAALEVGNTYRWYFLIYCDDSERIYKPAFVEGLIQREALTEALSRNELDRNAPQEWFEAYAEALLWYEVLATLVDVSQANPDNPVFTDSWRQILETVELEEINDAPIIGRYFVGSEIAD